MTRNPSKDLWSGSQPLSVSIPASSSSSTEALAVSSFSETAMVDNASASIDEVVDLLDVKGPVTEAGSSTRTTTTSTLVSSLLASTSISSLSSASDSWISSGDHGVVEAHSQESLLSDSASDVDKGSLYSRRKVTQVPIQWRRDFLELRLDQSRVRREFLRALREECPGVQYKVREVRWQA
ncbi:hypothetical protein BGW38_009429, partial [Lunasporangiospora selenospora]